MSDYRVGDGFNVPEISLTVLSPQPWSPGIQYTSQRFAADSTPIYEGAWVPLIYTALGSVTQYQSVLTTWGLLSADYNDVTVYVRNVHFSYVRMNGRAIKPIPERGVNWQRPFPRNIIIVVRDLEAST